MSFIQYIKVEFKDGFAYKDLHRLEGVEVLEAVGSPEKFIKSKKKK